MSRFEAEIMGGGGGHHAFRPAFIPSQMLTGGARIAPPTLYHSAPIATGGVAVISAPPTASSSSAAVISAPATINKSDDDDILATLQKYEKEVKSEAKKEPQPPKMDTAALAKEMASKKAKMMADQAKIKASTSKSIGLPTGVKAPPVATMRDEAVKKAKKQKRLVRTGGGQMWEDESLKEWDSNDFRIFCGDLGNDVTDEVLARTFGRYPSFLKAKVVRDKKSNKTKGFGFVSFRDPSDFTRAMREMNGKYVGSRPIKMRKSNWKDRNIDVVKHKQKEKQKMGYKW